jgi:hypothetical protein
MNKLYDLEIVEYPLKSIHNTERNTFAKFKCVIIFVCSGSSIIGNDLRCHRNFMRYANALELFQ